MRTLIVDDEPLAHEIILTFVKEIDEIEIVGQCFSGKEALAFVKDNEVDLIFLDIEMPVISGLDFLSLLPKKPQVIITSAYQEYAVEGFNMNVADYLLKPFRFDRFQQAIEKVQQRLLMPNSPQVEEATEQETLFIKVDKKHVQINLAEVTCFEAYGNYVKVWRNGNALLTPRTLTSFEQNLNNSAFVRVHKSAIINRHRIDFIESDKVTLDDGKSVAIGKQYKANLSF